MVVSIHAWPAAACLLCTAVDNPVSCGTLLSFTAGMS